MKKLRFLNVGCGWFSNKDKNVIVHNANATITTSFSDYDVVIIDPLFIPKQLWLGRVKYNNGKLFTDRDNDGGLGNSLISLFETKREETKILIEQSGGRIICFARLINSSLYVASRNFPSVYLNEYSWLPDSYEPYFDSRKGETVSAVDSKNPFSNYFEIFSNSIDFEVVIRKKYLMEKILARNKGNEIISAEFLKDSGKIIFLPPLKNFSAVGNALSEVITNSARESLGWSPSLTIPEWISTYKLPSEEKTQKEKDDLETKKREMEQLENAILEKEKKIDMFKSLLYGQGKFVLESAVKRAFKLVGFNIIPDDKYEVDCDLYIEEDKYIIVGEIQGTKNQIDQKKYRQLLDYVEDLRLKKEKEVMGILIGNGLIDTEPEKRGEQFTSHAIKGCEKQSYCRMTTFELFKTVKKILDKPEDNKLKNSIKQKIIDCKSEFKA
ncbi:MAG: hypothetical protein JW957_08545 [Candidatus Omnitrophica bacterium]|nr:hypothetical protein [Candidatus Omnitrophota bacterium]